MAARTHESKRDDGRSRPAETVLVTGCESSLGRSVARAFSRADWWVFAASADADALIDLDTEGIEPVELQNGRGEGTATVVTDILDRAGRIDCLVTVPPLGPVGAYERIPPADLRRYFDRSIHRVHREMRAVLPEMRGRRSGTIIGVLPVDARLHLPAHGPTAGAMAAADAGFASARQELTSKDVDVVTVEYWPAELWTDEGQSGDDAAFSGYHPVKRMIRDVADLGGIPSATTDAEIATEVLEAATCPDPDPRSTVGSTAQLAAKLRFIPARHRLRAIRALQRIIA